MKQSQQSQPNSQTKGKKKPVIDTRLIEKHMPLVQRLARRMAIRAPASIMADDLCSAGALGLIDSVIRNRSEDDASFACYVRMRIRGAIYDELRANDWLPRRARAKDQPEPTSGPPRPVAVIRFEDLPNVAENTPAATSSDSNPMESMARNRIKGAIKSALQELPKRDRLVLHLHYFKGMQIREIGRLLGVSEARISQIHHRALERIKPFLKEAA